MSGAALLDELLDPLAQCLDVESARRVADLDIAADLQAKLGLLAEKANEGTLSDAERADYEALINVADLLAILKLKARRKVQSDSLP